MGKRDRRHALAAGVLAAGAARAASSLGGAAAAWRLDLGATLVRPSPPDPAPSRPRSRRPRASTSPRCPSPQPVAAAADGGGLLDSPPVRRALAPCLADRDLGRRVHAAVAALERARRRRTPTGDGAFIPASTIKLLTAAAALAALGPDHRFDDHRGRAAAAPLDPGRRRRPVAGPHARRAGRLPDPRRRRDPGPADRRGAAARADARRRSGSLRRHPVHRPAENPFWRADYVPDDIVSPISRAVGRRGRSGRRVRPGRRPRGRRGRGLRRRAARSRASGSQGDPTRPAPPPGRRELASVSSAPLSQIVEHVLEVSDNEGAEVLAHHVGARRARRRLVRRRRRGCPADARRRSAYPLGGAVIRDGSGLSRENRLRPGTLLEVLRVAAAPRPPRPARRADRAAGRRASPARSPFRFDEAPPAGVGRVRAKTGTLTGVSALAGIATDQTGTPLVFVLAADRVAAARHPRRRSRTSTTSPAALGACRCSR